MMADVESALSPGVISTMRGETLAERHFEQETGFSCNFKRLGVLGGRALSVLGKAPFEKIASAEVAVD